MNNNNNSNDNNIHENHEENDGNNSEDSGADLELEEQQQVMMAGAGEEGASGSDAAMADDSKLREQLRRKYSSYIWSLKQEFLKKKKKGKLPKEARASLLHWWALHYKWPYPSVSSITKFKIPTLLTLSHT